MKTTPLALAYALLGATALASTALGQTSGPSPTPSSEPSPATSSTETAKPGTQTQHDWHSDRRRPYGRDTSRQYLDDEDEDMSDTGRGSRRVEGRPGGPGRGLGGGSGAGMPMGPAMMQMMREHQTMGARFDLRRGDSALAIRCPAGEPLNNCIDAAGRLIDKLQAIPQK